jgi:hypothetical protein
MKTLARSSNCTHRMQQKNNQATTCLLFCSQVWLRRECEGICAASASLLFSGLMTRNDRFRGCHHAIGPFAGRRRQQKFQDIDFGSEKY